MRPSGSSSAAPIGIASVTTASGDRSRSAIGPMPPRSMLVRVAIAMAATAIAAMTNRTADSSSGGAPVTPSFPVIHDPLQADATANAASGVMSERGTRERYEARMRPVARVLITGITGFAGSHLAEHLLTRGDEVHGLAHEEPPFPNLAAVADRLPNHPRHVA